MPKEEISHIFPNCENASLLAVDGISSVLNVRVTFKRPQEMADVTREGMDGNAI